MNSGDVSKSAQLADHSPRKEFNVTVPHALGMWYYIIEEVFTIPYVISTLRALHPRDADIVSLPTGARDSSSANFIRGSPIPLSLSMAMRESCPFSSFDVVSRNDSSEY